MTNLTYTGIFTQFVNLTRNRYHSLQISYTHKLQDLSTTLLAKIKK